MRSAGLVITAMSAVASAQSADISHLQPAGGKSDLVTTRAAVSSEWLTTHSAIVATYAHAPLILETPAGERLTLIRGRNEVWGTASLGLGQKLELAALVPFVAHQQIAAQFDDGAWRETSAGGTAMGSARIELRRELHGVGPIDLAVSMGLGLPSASSAAYTGEGITIAPELLASIAMNDVTIAANIGAKLRGTQAVGGQSLGSELTFRAGVLVPVTADLGMVAETFGSTPFGRSIGAEASTPVEGLVAARFREGPWAVTGGFGAGLVAGYGAPLYRVVVGLAFSPRAEAPPVAPVAPAPAVDVVAEVTSIEPVELAMQETASADEDPACETAHDPACLEPQILSPVGDVSLTQVIFFPAASSMLKPRALAALRDVARTLLSHPELTRIAIEGHTDTSGPARGNLLLSIKRAKAVRDELVRAGVAAERLELVAIGERAPRAKKSSSATRNRRVQFRILEQDPAKGGSQQPAYSRLSSR
jgi:outer membrane protein OmpA-like peptidoglycan-associated protein